MSDNDTPNPEENQSLNDAGSEPEAELPSGGEQAGAPALPNDEVTAALAGLPSSLHLSGATPGNGELPRDNTVEVYVARVFQPGWASDEPKPKQWAKGTFRKVSDPVCPGGKPSDPDITVGDLVKGKIVRRVSDMSDEDLRKAGYFDEEE